MHKSFKTHAKSKLKACWFAWNNLCRRTNRAAGLNTSSLSILFKCIVLTKLLYAAPVWLDKHLDIFKDFFARARLKLAGSEFHLPRAAASMLINMPPLDIMVNTCTVKFILKCLTSADVMNGLVLQVESTPGHPFYRHSTLVRQFVKWNSKTDVAVRNIDLVEIRRKYLVYDKALMGQYVGYLWDRELNSDSTLIVKHRDITTKMYVTISTPFLLRAESRKNQVHFLDFLHGRSARFRNFKKSVKLTSSDICGDCSVARDSNIHKLFQCPQFSGPEREEFIESIGGEEDHFEEQVLFAEDVAIYPLITDIGYRKVIQ